VAHHLNWIELVLFLLTIIGTVVASTLYITSCNAEQNVKIENHEVRIVSIEKKQDIQIDLLNQILDYEKSRR
jgi:hypothetical protein